MIRKIFQTTSLTITGAALILGAASFLSRLIGMLRDRIFAHMFGAGNILDAYYAAFRIPDLIYNLLIVGALSAGFIPVFTKLWTKDKDEAWRVTNAIINILGVGLIIICTILFFATPYLMPYLVPGFDGEKLSTTVLLTRIMFISPILLGLSSAVSGVLQSLKAFMIYAITPVLYNVGIIIGAIAFYPSFGIAGLGYGVLLGSALHLTVQIPTLYHYGFRYRLLFAWRDPNVRQIGRLMIPRTMGLAANQLNLVAITIIASTLGAGSIAIFNLANNLQYFAIGTIGVSFAIAAFPILSQFVAEEKQELMVQHLSSTIRQIIFLIIPVTILFLLLRAQIVRVVLGTGEFDWNATKITANTLAYFSFSLFAQCLTPLLSRAFYALHDTWTPFVISVITALINIILSLVLKENHGILGLALAFSIAMIIQLIMLWLTLRAKIVTLGEYQILRTLFKVSIAAIIMGVAIQSLKTPIAAIVNMEKFWGIAAQGFIAGGVGLFLYGAVCYALKLEEMLQLQQTIRRRWFKLWQVQGEIQEEI